MQNKQNADRSFLHAAPPDKVTFGQHIFDSLKAAGSAFPSLPYPTDQLIGSNDKLRQAIATAKSGNHNDIARRNMAEKDWDNLFSKTASYVSFLADGDVNIITLAGMTPTSADGTKKPAPATGQLKALALHSGGVAEIDMMSQGTGAVAAYMYLAIPDDAQLSTGGDGTLIITLADGAKIYARCDTHRSVMIGGMEANKPLKLVAQAVNSAGAGEISAPKSFTPQP